MKCFLLFFCFSIKLFAQTFPSIKVDSLPKEGILLDKGWKWHAGDNPEWAKADFDDSKWESINPFLTIPELPNISIKQSLWLRIKLNSAAKKAVAFSIKQSSASEIYLNGKLIKKYGKIGQSEHETIAYVPFDEYLVTNLDSLSNSLSIRIFFQEGIRYKQFQDIFYPLFICQIYSISQLPKYPSLDAYIGEGFNIGVPLILFLVYFTIFLFYKPNKSNLWFSLWGASNSLVSFLALFAKLTPQIRLQNTYTNWASIFSSFAIICLVYSIYLLLIQKRIWLIIGFIILLTISTVNYFLPNNSDPRIFGFVILLFYIGLIVYMSLNAIKSGNKGGKYVIIGIVFFIVFWTIFIFDLLGFNKSTIISGVNYHIAALSLPIIVATLLGLEFRNTNKSLLKNLEDIKKLSVEKQQILFAQNETLEKQVDERTAELVHKNRELEIEGTLDKIRSSSLAMRHSHEIQNVVVVLLEKLKELGLVFDSGAAIHIFTEGSKDAVIWVATANDISPTNKVNLPYDPEAFENNPIILDVWHAYKTGTDIVNKVYSFEEKNRYFNYVFKHNGYDTIPEFVQKIILNVEGYTASFVSEKNSLIGAASWSGQVFSERDFDILRRISKVFEQAYTRFLDLQKAEAQAREAQIEASLERIRSRAMAMNTSEEFNSLIGFIYVECTKLNMHLDRGFIMTFNKDTKDAHWWMVSADASDKPLKILVEYHELAPNLAILKGWEEREQRWSYNLEGNNKKTWDDYQFANALSHLPDIVKEDMRSVKSVILNASFQNFGCIMLSSFEPLTDDQFDLIQRFSKVFDQTYTRFLDLQKAETQAREAQIEASFERIRASALAMQTSKEFLGVVKTLYEQMNALDQKELEATIIQFYDIEQGFINSWNAQNIDKSTTGNITLGTANFPFNSCRLTEDWLNAYKSTQQDYTIVAKGDILKEWLLVLMKLSPEIKDRLAVTMPQISNFHFSKFSHGALSMVSQKPFSEESKYLLKRAASAFDLAYKRYLDLQLKEEQAIKLANEKQRLEEAVKELQSTQAQLIQKEKLASLGELTAGIAHEIQNPLNFVNNFSEVSIELANELGEALKQRGIGANSEERELVSDLIQNQEKIYHHGKRASSIVKGMLEHSRSSKGEKELTDINELADEYLRLSYHGLRAKDSKFQADYQLIADNKLPKINIVPQEIGRVLLNLINNAFYACTERSQSAVASPSLSHRNNFQPSVVVSTRWIRSHSVAEVNEFIELRVKDNGNGIPKANLEKIFQPFFTTKPTGEGTGLGLSLAYDIITKGHGGTLEVVSMEGEGAEFIIHLPITTI